MRRAPIQTSPVHVSRDFSWRPTCLLAGFDETVALDHAQLGG